MNNYELMFIVRPTLDEASIKKFYEDMQNVVTKANGKIVSSKEMGQRDLAYEINKYKTGYYFYFSIEAEGSHAVKEFDRVALINENIIRHLIVKVEE